MTNIKFRVWDEVKMISLSKAMFYDLVGVQHNREDGYNISCYYNNVKIMQFTGLKDKNGKDIYEGDICSIRNIPFTVKWDDKNVRFMGYSTEGYLGYVSKYPKVEVIGNIYENPELLKESEGK